jgi:hypothetical protein
MLETSLYSNGNLRRQAIVCGVDGGACDSRKLRINQNLTTYYYKNTRPTRIVTTPLMDPIKFRSLQPRSFLWHPRTSSASLLSFSDSRLIVLRSISSPFVLLRISKYVRTANSIKAERFVLSFSVPIDQCHNILRKSNRCLHLHTAIVPPWKTDNNR